MNALEIMALIQAQEKGPRLDGNPTRPKKHVGPRRRAGRRLRRWADRMDPVVDC